MASVTDQFQANLAVAGNLSCGSFSAPANCIGDLNVNSSSPLQCTKSYQQVRGFYSQPYGSVAASAREVIHKAQAAGLVYAIKAGLASPNTGAAVVTVDLKKNGVTVLTGTISLDNTGAAYDCSTGAVAITDYVVNDVFELVVTATAGSGTLGQGLFVDTIFRELPG